MAHAELPREPGLFELFDYARWDTGDHNVARKSVAHKRASRDDATSAYGRPCQKRSSRPDPRTVTHGDWGREARACSSFATTRAVTSHDEHDSRTDVATRANVDSSLRRRNDLGVRP